MPSLAATIAGSALPESPLAVVACSAAQAARVRRLDGGRGLIWAWLG